MNSLKGTSSSKNMQDRWMQCLGAEKDETFNSDSNLFVGENARNWTVTLPAGLSKYENMFIRGELNIIGAPLIGQQAQSTLECGGIYLIGGKLTVQNTNLNYRYLFVMTPEQFERGVLQHPNKDQAIFLTNQPIPPSPFTSHSCTWPIYPNVQDNLGSILKAAQVHDLAMVQFCVAAGIDRNNTIHKKTALMEAAENNNVSVIQLLLEAGAEVDATDATGNTPLMMAARGNHLQCAQSLLAAKADISAKNSFLTTATGFAINTGSAEMLNLFVAAGVDPFKERSLGPGHLHAGTMYAAVNGDTETLTRLLTLGRHIDAQNLLKDTALTLAAKYGQTGVVDLLIACEANLLVKGKQGTALDYAVQNGHASTILALLAAKVPMIHTTYDQLNTLGIKNPQILDILIQKLITSKPENADELLIYAMQSGKKQILESLLRLGVNPNISHHNLISAAIHGHEELVELFLKLGVDEVTALTSLIKSGQLQATQLLMHKGVVLDQDRFSELTLLQHVILTGDPANMQTLLGFNINLNATDSNGTTALMYAAERGNLQMTQQLIAANADPYAKDSDGKNALNHACLNGQVEIVEWFLSKKADGTQKFDFPVSDLSPSISETRKIHRTIRHAQKQKKPAELAPYAQIITLLGNALFNIQGQTMAPEKMSVAQQNRALTPKNTVRWEDEHQKPFLYVREIEAREEAEQKNPP